MPSVPRNLATRVASESAQYSGSFRSEVATCETCAWAVAACIEELTDGPGIAPLIHPAEGLWRSM